MSTRSRTHAAALPIMPDGLRLLSAPAPLPEVPSVAVLIYGLVRSAEMLDRTLPSIQRFLAPISRSAIVIANVECRFSKFGCKVAAAKLRNAGWRISNMHERVKRWRRWRNCTEQSYRIIQRPQLVKSKEILRAERETGRRMMDPFVRDMDNEAAAMLSLQSTPSNVTPSLPQLTAVPTSLSRRAVRFASLTIDVVLMKSS